MKKLSPEQKQNTTDLVYKAKDALVEGITEMVSDEATVEMNLLSGRYLVTDIDVVEKDEDDEGGVLVHTTRCDDDGEIYRDEFSLEDLDIGVLYDIFRFLAGKAK